jgi:hypothetical protein
MGSPLTIVGCVPRTHHLAGVIRDHALQVSELSHQSLTLESLSPNIKSQIYQWNEFPSYKSRVTNHEDREET